MDPITQFIIGIGMQIVGTLLAPRPEKPKPPSLKDYDEPTADASRPIPIIFGTVEMKGLNALWWGDKSIQKREVSPEGAKK